MTDGTDMDGIQWTAVCLSVAVYNYALALLFLVSTTYGSSLTTAFGLAGALFMAIAGLNSLR